ncbi:uncharacterized protein VP01_8081g1, partial [Puccinia sorghi]
ISVDHILNVFNSKTQRFDNGLPTITNGIETSTSDPKPKSMFSKALFQWQSATQFKGIQDEINQCSREDIEAEGFKVLDYWASQQKSFPKLSVMAHHYLSIPAPSVSSERVFSKGHWIFSWQCSSLKPNTFDNFLCLKDWFQTFNGPFLFLIFFSSLK